MGVQIRIGALTSESAWRCHFGNFCRIGLGQHWGNSRIGLGNDVESGTTLARCVAGPVHRLADFVEPIFEEVAVGVEGRGRRAVSQHLLDDFDVGSAGDGQTRGSVPEFVWVEVGYADGPGCRAERGAEGAHSQGLAVADAGEDQIVGRLAVEVTCEVGGEELRGGDLASLVGLGNSSEGCEVGGR